MENRWSDRRQLRLLVDVLRSGDNLFSCSSENIGLGGTCLQFPPLESANLLQKDQEVELIFHVPQGDRETKYSLVSKVVWQQQGNIGLKFQDYNTSVFRSLQELINYKIN